MSEREPTADLFIFNHNRPMNATSNNSRTAKELDRHPCRLIFLVLPGADFEKDHVLGLACTFPFKTNVNDVIGQK